MALQSTLPVTFRPAQCPTCANYIEKDHVCQASGAEMSSHSQLAVLDGESVEPCPRYEVRGETDPIEEIATPVAQVESEATALSENPSSLPIQTVAVQDLILNHARLYCYKCQSENPPTALRCQNCDANLLPAEGFGQRFGTFVGLLIGSAILGYLFNFFYIQNPGTAPDIVLCNVGALLGGAIVMFFMAFVQLLRKTPTHVKYVNRAKRHIDLNAWQALDDLNHAMDLAKDKDQGNLVQQRVKVYEKLGLTDEAARDYLALVTSSGAFKGTGEWISAFTGADAETISSGMSESQNKLMLQSSKAKAVGYCRQCDNVVVLNNDARCQMHPKSKVKEVTFVIPADVLAGKLTVMHRLEPGSKKFSEKITKLLDSGQARAVGYCSRCKSAVELDSNRHCVTHPKVKGQLVQYVVPGREGEGKRVVLRWRRDAKVAGRKQKTQILAFIALIFMGFALYLIFVKGF
jgi:hypothetical protein